MHRSGTSLVAKCFEVFGYGLGETLMAPSDDNPKGFFEDLDVVELNDLLLQENGSNWDAPVFVGQQPLSWSNDQLEAGVSLLKVKLEHEPRLAIKDPRLCLVLPYWRAVAQRIDVPLRVCLVYRNPLDIAASLHQRNELPHLVGLGLTHAYWTQLLRDTEPSSFVINYDNFLDDPSATLKGIEGWLIEPMNLKVAETFIDEFLDGGMQHHAHDLAELKAMPLAPQGLLDAAMVLNQRSNRTEVSAQLWSAATELDIAAFTKLLVHQLSDRLLKLKASTEKTTVLELENAQKGFNVDDLTRQKAEREKHIQVLEARIAETREALAISQSFADERVSELKKTQQDFGRSAEALHNEKLQSQRLAENLSEEVADKAALAEHLELTRGDLLTEQETARQLKKSLGDTKSEVRVLEGEVGTLEEKADWLFYLLETDYGRILQFETSFLGRLQRLGRRVYRTLTFQRGRATAYEDTVAAAHTFFADHELTVPASPPTKWQ